MIAIIDKYPLDTSLFRGCIINERLCLVYFIHRPQGLEGEISLPVLFENVWDTKRFFEEYCNSIYDNEPVYEFEGEAWFSLELYVRLRDGTKQDVKQHTP